MEIRVFTSAAPLPGDMEVEIVERKGLGHPDTICDAVMEEVSRELCAAYLERFGAIAHHNCDKGCLIAGQAEVRLGGGRILEPMRLILGDRATERLGDRRIDLPGTVIGAAKGWFRRNLPRVDPDRHVRYQVELKPGSEQLAGIFAGKGAVLGANDTSAVVGYAPLTETESLVLEAERHLNSPGLKERFPECGEDVKVMGVRRGGRLELTVAVPLVDRFVDSERTYFLRKEEMAAALREHLLARRGALEGIDVRLNALDRPGRGVEGIYLSVLGTSAEHGDSGQVGRGNGVNGLIALNRPGGAEAAAGKNPVSHVGKIYNLFSDRLARTLHAEVPGLRGVVVWMCSRIGEPVDRPWIVSVQVHPGPGLDLSEVEGRVRRELEGIPRFCEDLVRERQAVC